jgi:hypothetical protein
LFLIADLRLESEEPRRENPLSASLSQLEAQLRSPGGAEGIGAADECDGAAGSDLVDDGERELNSELATAVCLDLLSEMWSGTGALAFHCNCCTCSDKMIGLGERLGEACVAVDGANNGGGGGGEFVWMMIGLREFVTQE